MDKSCKDKLLACRTYAEAKPILETLSVGSSAHELAYTAFSIADKQPRLRDQFLGTVIQEAEEVDAKKEDTDKRDPLKEVDGGKSIQSSNLADPLPTLGKSEEAPEGAQNQPDKKDQMGVAINETFPMMPQGGMGQPQPQQQAPPMGGAPPMAPPAPPMMPPKPPMPPTPQQQQMQYIQEIAQYSVAPYFNRIVEAVKAIDRKVQEISKEAPRQLEIGSKINVRSPSRPVRETIGELKTPASQLESKRLEIEDYDRAINAGYIK